MTSYEITWHSKRSTHTMNVSQNGRQCHLETTWYESFKFSSFHRRMMKKKRCSYITACTHRGALTDPPRHTPMYHISDFALNPTLFLFFCKPSYCRAGGHIQSRRSGFARQNSISRFVMVADMCTAVRKTTQGKTVNIGLVVGTLMLHANYLCTIEMIMRSILNRHTHLHTASAV